MRVVVDTSIWIDYYRSAGGPNSAILENAMASHRIVVPTVVMLEILRGVPDEKTARELEADLRGYECVDICTSDIATKAAANYRALRSRAVTIRSFIDLLIGTWCIENGACLFHRDRDFEAMEKHLNLRCLASAE